MRRTEESTKRAFVYFLEIVYVLGSIFISFGPYVFFIWAYKLYPEHNLSSSTGEFLVRSLLVWMFVPIIILAILLDLYVKKIKPISKNLQKYGFLGRGYYGPS